MSSTKPQKTLHGLIKPPSQAADGRIPHVFHRRGPVTVHPGGQHLQMPDTAYPDTAYMEVITDTQKMAAYGVIAAGDSMVPWKGTAAGPRLASALRTATGTRLMIEAGGHTAPPAFNQGAIPDHVYDHACMAVAAYGTANQAAALKKATAFIRNYGLRYQAQILESLIEAAVEMAMEHRHGDLDWLYKEFHSLYGDEDRPDPAKPKPKPKPPEEPMPDLMLGDLPGGIPDGEGDGEQWGRLESILKVDMHPWKHPTVRSKRSWKYSEFGVFKYPWRALATSDYRCFSLARRQYGGTILIDMSGSMSIQQAQVERVLHIAPYATIAGYGAQSHNYGHIVIIAENSEKGRANDAIAICGSRYNVIDGPALQWLSRQVAPRIWISDGAVTGVNECQGPRLRADVERITRTAKITRIPTLGQLLSGLGVTGKIAEDEE